MGDFQATEIFPGLYQGGWPPPGSTLSRAGIHTLVLCAYEYQPPHTFPNHLQGLLGLQLPNPFPGVEVVYAPNDDNPFALPPREHVARAILAARVVANRLKMGKKVLVTCWQGRNRSGLVSALALHFYLGISGDEAARMVREKRHGALVNPQFTEMLSRVRPIPETRPTTD